MTAPAEDPRGGAHAPGGPLEFCCGQQAMCEYGGCYPYRRPPASLEDTLAAAGRGDTDSGGEHSTDLTPGVVWTDAQLSVVRDLTARAVRAEAAVSRVEALVHEWEKARDHHEAPILEAARELRAALDGT